MKSVYLIDSVILIDHLNGIKEATDWLLKNSERSVISVISRAEILAGIDQIDLKSTRLFLNTFQCYSIDEKIADKAAELRKKFRWKLPDAFQAAFAELNKISLVTRNTKDFRPEKHAFVFIPYTL
ncbi:MAG: type II toxin-antitoxin system VapC family toxin [Calditrichaeota bacterium]|nr:MAG: type II toxin-antitoxin system VapC family toxin [Calditrichota bacterium]MBL1204267.1 type II toxin-antitoxin system VapC family toxin [Calditrichota bacterium]NOG44097.1 PIN domain-containing protein [Calditrichota bacterium]